MSLESLTPEERAALKRDQDGARLLNELLTNSNAETRRAAQRLAKQARPDLRFAELESLEAEERATTAARQATDDLRKELEQERAMRLKAEEVAKIQARGFDPEAVYKAMTERGIVNLDTALDVFEAAQQLGESSAGSARPFKPNKAEIPKEVIADNGSVDIDALRSHLIEKHFEETQGRRRNPLGFVGQ